MSTEIQKAMSSAWGYAHKEVVSRNSNAVILYKDARLLDKPEGQRTKVEEWEGAYASLFGMLTPVMEENKRLRDSNASILRLIRETLDSPTILEPKANCRNLTRCLQEIERICDERI
jgi:hypothetical protein